MYAFHAAVTCDQLHEQVSRFWQLEDVVTTTHRTTGGNFENHFLENVSQTPQSKYVVELPVKESIILKFEDSM